MQLLADGLYTAMTTTVAYWQNMTETPYKNLEHQVEFWGKTLQNMMDVQNAFLASDPSMLGSKETDTRFENRLWNTNPYFNFVKNQYLQNSDLIKSTARNIDGLPEHEKIRLIYFTDQIVEMID